MASSTYKHRTLINPSTLKGKNVVMTSHGRAPWYTPDGKSIEAYVIGIAGGSASGKTSVARAILSALGYIPTVLILSQVLRSSSWHSKAIWIWVSHLDFISDEPLTSDHPDAIDMHLFAEVRVSFLRWRSLTRTVLEKSQTRQSNRGEISC
jgi:uridine kinase